MPGRSLIPTSLLSFLLAASLPARASDPAPLAPRYEIYFYTWGTGASGSISAGDVSKDFDTSFSEILDVLNIAAMAGGQMRWGRWLAQLDAFYVQIEEDTGNQALRVTPGPGPGIDVIARADAEIDESFVDLRGGYTLVERPLPDQGPGDPRRFGLDLLLGARWWYLEPTIDVRTGPFAAGYAESESWVDALVGMQAWVDLTQRLRLTAAGDIAGFSIGSAADRSWKATALLRWQVNERWNAYLAYRGMYVEHPIGERGNLELRHYGPMLGVGFVF